MMKEVLRALETGHLGEISVVAFFVAFTLVVVRAFLMSKQERADAKQMPLAEQEEHHPFVTQPEPLA